MDIRCVIDRRTRMLLFVYVGQVAEAGNDDLAPLPSSSEGRDRWEIDSTILPLYVEESSCWPCSSCPWATRGEQDAGKPGARTSLHPEVEKLIAQTIKAFLWCSSGSIRTIHTALSWRIAAINQSRPEEHLWTPSESTIARRLKAYRQKTLRDRQGHCPPCYTLPDSMRVDRAHTY